MKISKTRVGIAVATVALAVGCVAGAGCAAQQPEPSNAVAGTETTPKLMPASTRNTSIARRISAIDATVLACRAILRQKMRLPCRMDTT